jgi:hypothetical protein
VYVNSALIKQLLEKRPLTNAIAVLIGSHRSVLEVVQSAKTVWRDLFIAVGERTCDGDLLALRLHVLVRDRGSNLTGRTHNGRFRVGTWQDLRVEVDRWEDKLDVVPDMFRYRISIARLKSHSLSAIISQKKKLK